MSSPVEQIKDRLSIVDVVSSYIKIEKAGRNYKALSPFNKEKTPSFFISPEKGIYHCFSSGKGGDIFTFVQEMEGVDFPGALELLAKKAGVVLTRESPQKRNKRTRLYNILEEATKYFEEELQKSKEAQEYLKKRGIDKETTAGWRIGYARQSWDALLIYLRSKKFTTEEIEEVGLIKKGEKRKGDNQYYDRFRGRVMFPIADNAGRIIAYSGRYLPRKDQEKEDVAKYINSPETTLFNKSKVLYGYDKAKATIRKYDFSILVEGQIDVVLSHQAGFKNTVAISGTGLTRDHLNLLKRLSNNIVMAFDADSAGIASSGRGAEQALELGMDVKVAELPEGVDPADLVLRGKEKWRKVIRESKHIVEFYLDVLMREKYNARKLQLKIRELVLPFIGKIQNSMDQGHFVSLIASRVGIKEEPIWDELKKLPVSEIPTSSPNNTYSESPVMNRKDTLTKTLFSILFLEEERNFVQVKQKELKRELENILGKDRYREELQQCEQIKDTLSFEADVTFPNLDTLDASVRELLRNLEEECTKEELQTKIQELKNAEGKKDAKKVDELFKVCKELSDKLHQLQSSI